ncbi:MAG: MBL fold metallo-hydrolase, partial [Chloroflexi bacterium]|nr:MBL fold metallo-hydrolase [Chloroflexota bacterium]
PKMVDDLAQAAVLPVTGVLLPDGGSEALNPSAWLAKLQPLVAVISVEAGNRRGLPSAEVLRALEGTNILRTDVHGWIEFITDGEQLWVEVERVP